MDAEVKSKNHMLLSQGSTMSGLDCQRYCAELLPSICRRKKQKGRAVMVCFQTVLKQCCRLPHSHSSGKGVPAMTLATALTAYRTLWLLKSACPSFPLTPRQAHAASVPIVCAVACVGCCCSWQPGTVNACTTCLLLQVYSTSRLPVQKMLHHDMIGS